MDQAHVRHDQAHAPALQLADEVPLEQLAVRGDLLLEVLRAVLADEPHAGLRRAIGSSSQATYLVAARISTASSRRRRRVRRRRELRADARQVRAHALGARLAISSTMRPPPGGPRARLRGGGRRSARRRSCRPPTSRTSATPAASRRSWAIARRSMRCPCAWRPREGRVHLGRRPRSSRRPAPGPTTAVISPRRASSRSARTPSSSTPAASPRQPAWTIATAPLAAERDGQAVGGQHHRRRRRASAVAWPSASRGGPVSGSARSGLVARARTTVPWTW